MIQELRRTAGRSTIFPPGGRTRSPWTDRDQTLRLHVAGLVSGNGFELLGVTPALGRLIVPSDDVRGGPAEGWPVVLSYGFWKDRFGGDPA